MPPHPHRALWEAGLFPAEEEGFASEPGATWDSLLRVLPTGVSMITPVDPGLSPVSLGHSEVKIFLITMTVVLASSG